MKQCTNCKITKFYSEFYKMTRIKKDGSQGYRSYCKVCISEKTKNRRKIASEHMNKISRKSRDKNKHKYKERERKYYQDNKEAYKERQLRYQNDPIKRAKIDIRQEEWRQNNLERLGDARRKRRAERLKEDLVYKLKCNVRCRLNYSLKNKRVRKTKSTVDYLGCDWETLWKYLNNTFEENYGMPREWLTGFEYEIDHIEPMSKAETKEEVIRKSHYSNLQILLTEDNRSKKDREDWDLLTEGII
jgi:hypothetical protein